MYACSIKPLTGMSLGQDATQFPPTSFSGGRQAVVACRPLKAIVKARRNAPIGTSNHSLRLT